MFEDNIAPPRQLEKMIVAKRNNTEHNKHSMIRMSIAAVSFHAVMMFFVLLYRMRIKKRLRFVDLVSRIIVWPGDVTENKWGGGSLSYVKGENITVNIQLTSF